MLGEIQGHWISENTHFQSSQNVEQKSKDPERGIGVGVTVGNCTSLIDKIESDLNGFQRPGNALR